MISLRFLAAVLVVAPATFAIAQQPARDARKIYAEFCASCHGDNLQGGSAPSLVSNSWTHGGDDISLAASIRDGHPENGMPGFGENASNNEIRGLVVYINEQAGHAALRRTPPPRPGESIATGKRHSFHIENVSDGLNEPYALAFPPDGRFIVTEKRGNLRVIERGAPLGDPVSGTPPVDSNGQAGLFDVVLHPDFARNGWIYLAFSDPQKSSDGKPVAMTSIVRGHLTGNAWTDQEVIYRAPIDTFRNPGGVHYGGRLAFDKNNFLFFSIGERGNQINAQDLTLPNGKIHRLHDDGRVPADNPFIKTPGALPSIWSYGHRNPQGLRFHPATGELWSHEHGPRGGDELNVIQPGLNYGWPVATFGINYNGTPITDVTARPDIQPPVTYWLPSIAPCGLAIYSGDRFAKWKNHLFVASLAAEELRRLEIGKDGKVIDQEIIFKGLGRMRDVANGPDGFLYILFPNRIVRLVPADH